MRIILFILILSAPLLSQEISTTLLQDSEMTFIKKSPTRETFGMPSREGLFVCRAGDVLYYITAKNSVVAKQISSKNILWRQPIEGQDLDSIYITPKVLIVTSADNFAYGLNRITGKILWQHGKAHPVFGNAGWGITPKVAVLNDTAYITYDNSVTAEKDTTYEIILLHISLVDGKILWERILKGCEPSGIELTSDTQYLAVIMRDFLNTKVYKETGIRSTLSGRNYLVDARTGKIVGDWVSEGETRLWDAKAINTRLIVSGSISDLFVFDSSNLKLLTHLSLSQKNRENTIEVPNIKICADGKTMAIWNAFPSVEPGAPSPVHIRYTINGKLLKVLKASSGGRILSVMCDTDVIRVAHLNGITTWFPNDKSNTLEKHINYVVDIDKKKTTVITEKGLEEIVF